MIPPVIATVSNKHFFAFRHILRRNDIRFGSTAGEGRFQVGIVSTAVSFELDRENQLATTGRLHRARYWRLELHDAHEKGFREEKHVVAVAFLSSYFHRRIREEEVLSINTMSSSTSTSTKPQISDELIQSVLRHPTVTRLAIKHYLERVPSEMLEDGSIEEVFASIRTKLKQLHTQPIQPEVRSLLAECLIIDDKGELPSSVSLKSSILMASLDLQDKFAEKMFKDTVQESSHIHLAYRMIDAVCYQLLKKVTPELAFTVEGPPGGVTIASGSDEKQPDQSDEIVEESKESQ
jgi:hypothetical protein